METLKESEFSSNIIPRGIYLTTIQKFQRGEVSDGLTEKADEEASQKLYGLLLKLSKRYLDFLKKGKNPKNTKR